MWMEASWARPLWRTTSWKVFGRVVAGRGRRGSRAGNNPGRGRARGQGPQAVSPPCALSHADRQAVGGTVRDREMGPRPQAQATGREPPQTPPSFGVDDQGQQQADCRWTQHGWQCSAVPGPNARQNRPWALTGARIRPSEAREVDTEGPLRALLLMAPREKVLAAPLCGALVRGAPGGWRERLDGLAGHIGGSWGRVHVVAGLRADGV